MEQARAFVIVVDACGVGALPDAAAYGDAGTNTLAHVAEAVGGLELPALQALGLGCILPLRGVSAVSHPAIHGRLHPLGPGKDSATGHWELMGAVLEQALPTYPDGFPPEVIAQLEAATGYAAICNEPYNGIAAIEHFGAEHLRTGALILYTSQDSVLQIAAHVERVPLQELYEACAAARETMCGEHAVGRVIARPFAGADGAFERTPGRRDFAVPPPGRTYLDELSDADVPVHGVGKVEDLFAGSGIAYSHAGSSNEQALASTDLLLATLDRGLVFVNLIETDQLYGHRKDVHGFAAALRELDEHVARWLPQLRERDLLIVTADHGVDPSHAGTDHTREYAPLLAVTGEMLARGLGLGPGPSPGRGRGVVDAGDSAGHAEGECADTRHDGLLADVGATVLRWLADRDALSLPGGSFIS
jgi:phosphopentomutase